MTDIRTTTSTVDMERALIDPEGVFGTPETVRGHQNLTDAQKVSILRRWAYDVNEGTVAGDEGMPGENS